MGDNVGKTSGITVIATTCVLLIVDTHFAKRGTIAERAIVYILGMLLI